VLFWKKSLLDLKNILKTNPNVLPDGKKTNKKPKKKSQNPTKNPKAHKKPPRFAQSSFADDGLLQCNASKHTLEKKYGTGTLVPG